MSSIEFGNRMNVGSQIDSAGARELREALRESEGVSQSGEAGSTTFGDFLSKMVHEANASQLNADKKLQEVAAGRNKDLHGAVLSMEQADVQFRLLAQVRNKVIEAYREIMRMQV
jgi:flagellar hook-basal body complex protein FliE